ncbi:MAG TPA: hypothetical protein VG963_28230 [Polyangiaceae bacterium]|nr:hypothetical protein [Polyangiaceae bacterium]
MKSIEFYDLPRPVQERFVAAARASLTPAPLAIKPAPHYVGLRWFVAAGLVLLGTTAFASRGFGDLERASALATVFDALLYCVGFAIGFACLIRGLTLRDQAVSLPFERATYLFPMGVVEATSSALNIHSLADLRTVEAHAAALAVTFVDGTHFEFPARDQDQADAAKRAVTESRDRLDEATRADSVRSLAALDPLCRINAPSPISEDAPYARPTRLWATLLLSSAVIAGTAVGIGLFRVRNQLSARRLAAAARELDTTLGYREYIQRGGTLPEVMDVLLPRAELRDAVAEGSVEAIEHYIATHPSSKINGEVDAALQSALLAALNVAKAKGTLAALDEFASAHPRHEPVARELSQARHDVYRAAAQHARDHTASTGTRHADPAAFFTRLVDYAEQHGPKVQIRFHGELGKSAKAADTSVRGGIYFAGNASLPSRHFGEDETRRRDALAGALLVTELQRAFAPEIVHFELGPDLPSSEDAKSNALPPITVPTLFIRYRTELQGSVTNTKPRGIFFGAGVFYETSFRIPGEDSSLDLEVKTWRSPSRHLMRLKSRSIADVYEDVARRSLTLFLRRYLGRLEGEPSEVKLPHVQVQEDDADEKQPKDDRDDQDG